jgi:hypothetical protein
MNNSVNTNFVVIALTRSELDTTTYPMKGNEILVLNEKY